MTDFDHPEPRGLPSKPWPALTADQREHAAKTLQLYLTDHYALRDAYRLPQYVFRRTAYRPEELPEDYSAADTARRPVGGHGDPTATAAAALIDGPPPIILMMPYFEPLPHDAMRSLFLALPTHLQEPLRAAYIYRQSYMGAGERLNLGYKTVERRCKEGLAALCSIMYAERWAEQPEPSTPEARDAA